MLADLVQKAKEELQTRPLIAIDKLLGAFSEMKQPDEPDVLSPHIELFCRAILNVTGPRVDLPPHQLAEAIFDQNISRQNRRFIASSLLRLLAINDACFPPYSQFRADTFKLFDAVLSGDLYRHLGIKASDQTFEKDSKLKDAAPTIELQLEDLLSSFNSLDDLRHFRKHFMQTLNSGPSKAVLWPFLPRRLLDIRLDGLFNAVHDYATETTSKVPRVYAKANKTLQEYLSEANEYGTKYSRLYLSGVASKLRTLLRNHFEQSPFRAPASLTINPSNKRYPFYGQGRALSLGFIVKNDGPGYAFDASLEIVSDLQSEKTEFYLGHLEPTSTLIEIPCKVSHPSQSVYVTGELTWSNFDGTGKKYDFQFSLNGQRSDIDWETLARQDPYSLEPVSTEDDLVGRREILDQLVAQAHAASIGSSYVFGQKRVGKTSIAKALKTRLAKLNPEGYTIIYLEGGDYVHPNPEITLERLGLRLCSEIQDSDQRFRDLQTPTFNGALSPLDDFLRAMRRIAPTRRVLFILDEFDELPLDLYKRGPIGDSFFLTLRAISNKPQVGFVLVGGEKMDFILSCQGDALNKFQVIRVDYFDKEQHWADFHDLICKPVSSYLDLADESIVALYEQTSGNPYFAKLLCRSLFELMVQRRDSHVTRKEIGEATRLTLRNTASNSFQHFWEDGISATGARNEQISMDRRRLLLAFAEALRKEERATKDKILDLAKSYALESPPEIELRDFERRQVLITDGTSYRCKARIFETWLKERGIHDIITTFSEPDAVLALKAKEEKAYLRSEELVRLVERWSPYQGRRITEDQVRVWLSQFEDNTTQRIIFKILQGLRFYNNDTLRSKMKEVHGIVIRGLVHRIEGRKRSDIVVSYLDTPGKSGAAFAKLYADENQLYYANVIERNKISETLEANPQIQALVFVDDFVGTGNSACEYFRQVANEHGDSLRNTRLRIVLVAVSGFPAAKARIEETLEKLDLPIQIYICDPLDDSAKCFSEQSRIFPGSSEREKAKEICYRYGIQLEKSAPLGYGDCQAAIVFPSTCPNNCLPIIWSDSRDWRPLFRRQ